MKNIVILMIGFSLIPNHSPVHFITILVGKKCCSIKKAFFIISYLIFNKLFKTTIINETYPFASLTLVQQLKFNA